jgi:hypothetical protein
VEKDRASPSRETRERDRDGVSPLDAEYDAERVREYVREYACESGSRASRGAYGARAATRLAGVAGVRGVCANVPRDARADAGTATASFSRRRDSRRASRRGVGDDGPARRDAPGFSASSDPATSHSGLSWYRRASASAAATTREPGDISRREANALRFAAVDPSRRALRRCAAVEAGERHNSGLLDSGLLRAASGGDEPDADGDASDATPRLASVARRTPRTPSTRTVPRETPKGPGGVLFSLSSFLDAVKVVALARRQSPENSGDRDDPP